MPFIEKNVMPAAYEGNALVFGVIIAIVLGLVAVYLLSRYEKPEEKI